MKTLMLVKTKQDKSNATEIARAAEKCCNLLNTLKGVYLKDFELIEVAVTFRTELSEMFTKQERELKELAESFIRDNGGCDISKHECKNIFKLEAWCDAICGKFNPYKGFYYVDEITSYISKSLVDDVNKNPGDYIGIYFDIE